jgi:coproporphyrinogen dehydrogenase HemZ
MKILINKHQYRQEVHQVINAFYTFEKVEFVETEKDYDIFINVKDNEISIQSKEDQLTHNSEKDTKASIKEAMYLFLSKTTGINIPWGVLLGIRPSKIAMQLLNDNYDKQYILDYYVKNYLTSIDKAELCYEVAQYEKKIVNKDKNIVSIYLGMPFCPTRCFYCSFASNPIAGNERFVEPYLKALTMEIEAISKYIEDKNLKIESVYFGGGTPTAVNDMQFENIMHNIYNSFIVKQPIKEFTVECGRPDSITLSKLSTMKNYEVNRISINPQSMNDETLKAIGRKHSVEDVINKFGLARELGFENINMDIIIGLPGEGIREVEETCKALSELKPDSITIHGMSIKRASKMHENLVLSGESYKYDSEKLNSMFEIAKALAKNLTMNPYYMYRQKNMVGNLENVGYSLPGKEGIYNVQMIEDKQTIIALGADAVSKVVFLEENRLERFPNIKDVCLYVERINEMIAKKIKFLDTLF